MQTEYNEPAEVKRLRTEPVRVGAREFRPTIHNKRRIVLEVDVIPQNGSTIEERYVSGVDRLEVYEDRIHAVLRYLVPAQLNEIRAYCERTAEGHRREWLAVPANRKALEQHLRRECPPPTGAMSPGELETYDRRVEDVRREYLDLKCNIRPEQYVVLYDEKYRTGLGKLRRVSVVALDGETTCTPEEFFELDEETKARDWFMPAPATVENSAQRATEPLTHALKDVLLQLREENSATTSALVEAIQNLAGDKPAAKPKRGRGKTTDSDAA